MMVTSEMFIVTSFSFGGESTVQIHIVTEDADLARSVYDAVSKEREKENKIYGEKSAARELVELTELAKDTRHDATLFWGEHAIVNNNH